METHRYTPLVEETRTSRQSQKWPILLITFLIVIALLFSYVQFNQTKSNDQIRLPPPQIFTDFYNCFYPKLINLRGNYEEFWRLFVNLTQECDNVESYKILDIRHLENQDETKYIALPKHNENITMVTLGIGHDVDAEMKLKELYPSTKFYGVDPASEINKNLYESTLGGSYFQVAISGHGGVHNSHVFKETVYVNEMTMHIGADYFFGDMIQEPRIDVLWIDTEGHEYTLLEHIHRNESIARKGVTICQINVEMHQRTFAEVHDEKQRFHDFVWRVLEDGKYIILKPFFVLSREFIRVFIVNVADESCRSLYF